MSDKKEKIDIMSMIVKSVAGAAALGVGRMVITGRQDINMWLLVGGVGIAQLPWIESKLPASMASGWFGKNSANIIAGVIGALAYELAFDGNLQMSDLNQAGLIRMATGAALGLVAKYAASSAADFYKNMTTKGV